MPVAYASAAPRVTQALISGDRGAIPPPPTECVGVVGRNGNRGRSAYPILEAGPTGVVACVFVRAPVSAAFTLSRRCCVALPVSALLSCSLLFLCFFVSLPGRPSPSSAVQGGKKKKRNGGEAAQTRKAEARGTVKAKERVRKESSTADRKKAGRKGRLLSATLAAVCDTDPDSKLRLWWRAGGQSRAGPSRRVASAGCRRAPRLRSLAPDIVTAGQKRNTAFLLLSLRRSSSA